MRPFGIRCDEMNYRYLKSYRAKCFEKAIGPIHQNEEVVVLSGKDQGEGTAIFVVVVVLFPL